jgi:hypothetical protein
MCGLFNDLSVFRLYTAEWQEGESVRHFAPTSLGGGELKIKVKKELYEIAATRVETRVWSCGIL